LSDKTDLLDKLRLDRNATRRRATSRLAWPIVGGLVLTGLGVGAYFLLRPADAVPVGFAVARAPQGGKTASLLDASGYVVARRQATVAAKITARVTEILIEEGQHVAGGQIMARLDDSNIHAALVQAEAQRRQAEANLSAARVALADEAPIFKRQQDLNIKGWVASADLDEERAKFDAAQESVKVSEQALAVATASLAIAERNQEDTVVRAPYDGVITVKAAQPGEVVSPLSAGGGFTRTGIGTLVDMDSLEVEVDVGENFIDRVRPGQDAQVRLNAYPDQPIPAYVIAIIPTADRSKATVKVRVGFRQKDARILPEMGARVAFLAPAAADRVPGTVVAAGLLVPAAAVIGSGDTAAVFVVKGERVERRAVKLGAKSGADQVVLGGLALGETVATGDLAKLVEGTKVTRSDNN
jgi:RND family efflux transporter MFP subunit